MHSVSLSTRFIAIAPLTIWLMFSSCRTVQNDRPDIGQDVQVATSPELNEEFRVLLQAFADARWALTEAAAQNGRVLGEKAFHPSYLQLHENGDVVHAATILKGRTPERAAAMRKEMLGTNAQVTIRDVDARVIGDTAAVVYVADMRITFNDETVTKLFRATDTFIRRGGKWQSLLHTETVMPGELKAAVVDTKRFDDYVGKYRLTPSVVYTVTRDGDTLQWGTKKRELVPESEATFGFRRQSDRSTDLNTMYRVVFVRNGEGKVTHLRMIEFPGVAYDAIKIE